MTTTKPSATHATHRERLALIGGLLLVTVMLALADELLESWYATTVAPTVQQPHLWPAVYGSTLDHSTYAR